MIKAKTFEIKKQERETNLSLVRRFTKRVKESGVLRSAKKAMFMARKQSPAKQKSAALRRIVKQEEYEKDYKLGKIS
ncbi:MAG: hypothetical protein Q7K38_03060 [Candidatus Wildermuthbacteria bacterium]|nr:hypothetical protein [Candidatus Wildermuthbacteria bacterium]